MGQALQEAGFAPNKPNEAFTKKTLVEALLRLTRKCGRLPTYADVRLEKQTDETFPNYQAFKKLGTHAARQRRYVVTRKKTQSFVTYWIYCPRTRRTSRTLPKNPTKSTRRARCTC